MQVTIEKQGNVVVVELLSDLSKKPVKLEFHPGQLEAYFKMVEVAQRADKFKVVLELPE